MEFNFKVAITTMRLLTLGGVSREIIIVAGVIIIFITSLTLPLYSKEIIVVGSCCHISRREAGGFLMSPPCLEMESQGYQFDPTILLSRVRDNR